MLYSYRKATPDNPHPGRRIPKYLKTIPTLVSALGLGILGGVSYPIVRYDTPLITLYQIIMTSIQYKQILFLLRAIRTSEIVDFKIFHDSSKNIPYSVSIDNSLAFLNADRADLVYIGFP